MTYIERVEYYKKRHPKYLEDTEPLIKQITEELIISQPTQKLEMLGKLYFIWLDHHYLI